MDGGSHAAATGYAADPKHCRLSRRLSTSPSTTNSNRAARGAARGVSGQPCPIAARDLSIALSRLLAPVFWSTRDVVGNAFLALAETGCERAKHVGRDGET